MRVRVSLPETNTDGDWPASPLIAHVTVENKRDLLAHIDASRSCLIDPDEGALNLAISDRILPANSWVRFSGIHQSILTINMNPFTTVQKADNRIEPGDRQRMCLHVKWTDGSYKDVDLTYAVGEKQPPQVASGAKPARVYR